MRYLGITLSLAIFAVCILRPEWFGNPALGAAIILLLAIYLYLTRPHLPNDRNAQDPS